MTGHNPTQNSRDEQSRQAMPRNAVEAVEMLNASDVDEMTDVEYVELIGKSDRPPWWPTRRSDAS